MLSASRPARSRGAVIGVIGDRDPDYLPHRATEEAFTHIPAPPGFEWVPTEKLTTDPATRLTNYMGLLIAPGRPYRNPAGVVAAIKYARTQGVPILGTCGGFQHMVIEYIRNVLGFADADHEETNPTAPRFAVTALACSLAGQKHPVMLIAGTRAATIYRATQTIEPFFCNYGLNPAYRRSLEQSGLIVSGVGEDGQVRILELQDHPFFFATLYVPQARSMPEQPHPLVSAFVVAAREGASLQVKQ